MKTTTNLLALFSISIILVLSACNKENSSYDKDGNIDDEIAFLKADLELDGDGKFTKVITKPLVKLDECKYITEGTIEFYENEDLVFTIDFGDGECDNLATKTVGDETTTFKLNKKGKYSKFEKIIVEPLVKLDDCDYIVAGEVEFYKEDTWVATINFGDGECDEWATKTWDGGSKVFSMNKDK